ncbi:DUF1918 domain-containing protein [Actinoplanes sp. NPDC048967]|uniref:DUF1918 domain-containing protein n=1 Tax=Actinoplanes sp. NPDC048967 TaxID=3155269 RepID=UPI0033E9E0A7
MKAHIGDRLVLEGTHLGDGRRTAVVTALHHRDGTPPYEVRWLDDGRTTLIFPGPQARIEPATQPGTPMTEPGS